MAWQGGCLQAKGTKAGKWLINCDCSRKAITVHSGTKLFSSHGFCLTARSREPTTKKQKQKDGTKPNQRETRSRPESALIARNSEAVHAGEEALTGVLAVAEQSHKVHRASVSLTHKGSNNLDFYMIDLSIVPSLSLV